jgi:mannose-6-phosphate isomerase
MSMSTAPRPSTTPFDTAAHGGTVLTARHLAPRTQDKPWGSERIWADGSGGYVGKLLLVDAGRSLSLQWHRTKDETLMVISGEVVFESGSAEDALVPTTMLPGDTVHVPATVLHRLRAVSDSVLAEVSTAGAGWQHDVVRVSDDYGREGTSSV